MVGVVGLALGLLGITFGLIESSTHPWGSRLVAGPLVVGVAFVIGFGLWERRTSAPMLPPQLLRARSFVTGCGVYLLAYLALTGVMFYVTLLFQNIDGWSPLRTGLSWLSMNIPFLVTAQFAGRLNRLLPPWAVVAGGCLVGACGVATLGSLTASTPFAVAFVGYVLLGSGWGALVPSTINVAMRDVPLGTSGGGSAIVNAARQVGTSVGLAVLGAIGVNAATSAWAARTSSVTGAAQHAQAVAGAQIALVTKSLGPTVRSDAVDAFLTGYHWALLTAAACTLLAGGVAAVGLRHLARPAVPEPAPAPAVEPGSNPVRALD